MADFCLGSHAIIGITRQVQLMDRMCETVGFSADAAREADPGLWYEARMRCIDCTLSQQCAQFLVSARTTRQADVPSFCANRAFFIEQTINPAPGRVQ
jgi:hypothetical protein